MKVAFMAMWILMTGFAYGADSNCTCSGLTKVCTTESNGSRKDVFVTVYDSNGRRIQSDRLAFSVSTEEAIAILNSRACGN